MRKVSCIFLLVMIAGSGCGSKLYKPTGRVVKNGAPFVVPEDEKLLITFVPIAEKAREGYPAILKREDGTFYVTSRNMKGLPAGKYRVFLDYKAAAGSKPPLSEALLDSDESSFEFDIGANTKEIVIDLDQPKKGS
jgi:hypothetical protein